MLLVLDGPLARTYALVLVAKSLAVLTIVVLGTVIGSRGL